MPQATRGFKAITHPQTHYNNLFYERANLFLRVCTEVCDTAVNGMEVLCQSSAQMRRIETRREPCSIGAAKGVSCQSCNWPHKDLDCKKNMFG